jgi:histidinol-phosphate aminotransferase
MAALNRRNWLKYTGLTASSLLYASGSLAHRLDNVLPYQESVDFSATEKSVIKLNANENPYGPSEKVRAAITARFDELCRYPGSYSNALTEKIAQKEGVTPAHILLTVGSTEGLKISAITYFLDGGELIAADPTFEAMINYAEALGAYIHKVPLNKELQIDLEAMAMRCHSATRMVFLCNPNNPTGNLLESSKVESFCSSLSSKTIVFSDEAYCDYIYEPGYPSMTSLVKKGQNVIVSKTFSKVYGLAGIRVGYLVARPDIISRIRRFRVDSPNILALRAAEVALEEETFFKFSLQRNTEAKLILENALKEAGLQHTNSHANFVFFNSGMELNSFAEKMMKYNIMVGRAFSPLHQWCRISTGKIEHMEEVGNALRSIYG